MRNDVKRVQVFTARPVAIGVAIGVLVAAAAGLLIGVMTQRRPGVWMLAWIVMSTPTFLVGHFFEIRLSREDDLVLKLLLLSTSAAAYALGGIVATLNHLDDDADPLLDRVTPPPGERGSAS